MYGVQLADVNKVIFCVELSMARYFDPLLANLFLCVTVCSNANWNNKTKKIMGDDRKML